MDFQYNLNENELMLFCKVKEGKVEEAKEILKDGNVSINCLDEHGMTPLQHAAYKGSYELCKLFIDCGADVNSSHHDHRYSTLMFAGLSGNLGVVTLLLENGASTTAVNSINRTASQLAAFVGNHDVVSLITNFIPREEIDWYTQTHDKQTEAKLPTSLAKPVHQLIIQSNVNPVRLAIFLQSNLVLLEESQKITGVLDHLCGKQLNDKCNEMLSLKIHFLSFVVKKCAKYFKDLKDQLPKDKAVPLRPLEPLIKHWIKEEKEKIVPVALEQFVRQSIREYPFSECTLFQQFVRTIAPVPVGNEPSAITVFSQAVGGQRGLEESIPCQTCGQVNAEKKCSVCKSVQYCDKYCQKLHWFTHKEFCPTLAKEYLEYKDQASSDNTETTNTEEEIKMSEQLQNIDISCV